VSVRKDGILRYDGHWQPVRQAVLERDDYVCQVRGPGCRRRADEVDHVIPIGAGGLLYDEENCRACGACSGRGRTASGSEASHRAGISESLEACAGRSNGLVHGNA
jgi:5-methylcytosine-specific restriction endonuclease McrA